MKTLTFLLFFLTAYNAFCETLIRYEQRAGDSWALALAFHPDDVDLDAVFSVIVNNPDARLGPNFFVAKGLRGTIEETVGPDVITWTTDDTVAGQVLVFWTLTIDGANSIDPADYQVATFDDVAGAQAFINEILKDPARNLFDTRPLLVQSALVRQTEPGPVSYVLTFEP
jgi:hypothetical protein